MKKQLLLYLFILSVLINVFTYMYFSKKDASDQKKSSETTVKYKDSLQIAKTKLYDADYFSLEKNDRAQNYFGENNLDYIALIPKIQEALLEYNSDPEGNKYVDQANYGNQKYIINKIKILNHRWIIADFSNGELWGEVLLKYLVQPDGSVTFETLQTYLYAKQLN